MMRSGVRSLSLDATHSKPTTSRPAAVQSTDLQVFSKYFQINVVPIPSLSKECFGGFVGFQWVAIDPNPKVVSKLFALQVMSPKGPRQRPNKSGSAAGLIWTLA
jgi:hypothetical protein